MGIYHFFGWFKNQFSGSIKKLSPSQNFESIDVNIDNLMIDMNGIFHNSAQKIYQYGNFKPNERFLQKKPTPVIFNTKTQTKVYEDVCKSIDELLLTVQPKKRLILCVDGPAPYAKQVQQKRRRFKSAHEREEDDQRFDSNQITPGTKFMDHLSKYIDWYIRKRMSEDSHWRNIEVVFSNEKTPGEGEHIILNYVRKYGNVDESFCIHGADADLIMLSLGTHYPNFYILRDDTFDHNNKYFVINIANTAMKLAEIMRWNCEKFTYDEKNAIDDFVFLCFMVGNDFLPHVPSLEIIESGIDIILSIYRDVGTTHGHLVKEQNNVVYFQKESLRAFFEVLSSYEKPILEKKLKNRRFYFPDEILESCANITEENIVLDIDKYRDEYFKKYFSNQNIDDICNDYLNGLHWVINYYKKGVPDWRWYYPYDYAPTGSMLIKYIPTFRFPRYQKTVPLLPFQQLLSVLPPKSAKLLPEPLHNLILNDDSPIKDYYPDDFEVDLSGKKNEWQGVVRLPISDPELIIKVYSDHQKFIDEREIKRNIFGKSFIYRHDESFNETFKSYYGTIVSCKVRNQVIYI